MKNINNGHLTASEIFIEHVHYATSHQNYCHHQTTSNFSLCMNMNNDKCDGHILMLQLKGINYYKQTTFSQPKMHIVDKIKRTTKIVVTKTK